MSINIVDRRKNSKGKSSENRQRLLKRVEDQIKKALPDIVKNTNVKDLTSSNGNIKVPVKGILPPIVKPAAIPIIFASAIPIWKKRSG